MNKNQIKEYLRRLFRSRMNEEIGNLESKKISPNPESTRVEYKGVSGDIAKQKAKEKVIKEISDILQEIYITSATKKPQTFKRVKYKTPKIRKAPRSPKGYKRKVYVPVKIYSSTKREIYKTADFFDQDSLYLNDWKDLFDTLKKYDYMATIKIKWDNYTPDPTCRVCAELHGQEIDLENFWGGKWGISHPKCDCLIRPIVYFKNKRYVYSIEDGISIKNKFINIVGGK